MYEGTARKGPGVGQGGVEPHGRGKEEGDSGKQMRKARLV